jgi:hypothetical protein
MTINKTLIEPFLGKANLSGTSPLENRNLYAEEIKRTMQARKITKPGPGFSREPKPRR